MVFKVIDGQIVGLTKNIQTLSIASENNVSKIITGFNNLKTTTGLTTKAWDTMVNGIERKYGLNAANYLRDVAKQGDGARASVKGFYTAITQDIPTHGIANVKSVIDAYNSLDPATQSQFAQAIGTTNKNLGNYLTGLNGAKAGMAGYGAQIVATTAKTIGLRAVTMALNAVIGIFVSLAITGITKLINAEKEAIKTAKEAAEQYKDETKSLDEYKSKIKELSGILTDNKSTTEQVTDARKQLQEIQDTLINKYGVEKDKIDLVNGSLKEQLGLIDKVSIKKAEAWQRENKKGIDSARNKVEKVKPFNRTLTYAEFKDTGDLEQQLISAGFAKGRSSTSNLLDIGDVSTTDEYIEKLTKLYDFINEYRRKNEYALRETENGWSNIDKILERVSGYINSINNEDYQNAKATYDQYTETLLLTEEKYRNFYSDLIDVQAEYNKAVAKGDKEAVTESLARFNEIKENYQNAFDDGEISDNGVAKWFDDFFNNFTIEPVEPDVKVLPTVSADTSNLKSKLAGVKEQIEDVFKNTNIFDKAIESLKKGESIDFSDVQKMVEVDSSLAGAFTKTADGYTISANKLIQARRAYIKSTEDEILANIESAKQTKTTAEENIDSLQAQRDELAKNINSASDVKRLEEFDNAIQSNTNSIDDCNDTISQETFLLRELQGAYADTTTAVDDFKTASEKASKKVSLIKTAMEEMNDTGHISASTYADIIEQGGNFADCLEIVDGKLILNVEKLKKLEAQQYANRISANALAIGELKASRARAIAYGADTKLIDEEIAKLEAESEAWRILISEINNAKPDEKTEKDKNKPSYSNDLQKLKDQLEDKKITYEQFLKDWQALNDKYHAMSEEDGGISDYEYEQNNRQIIAARKDAYEQDAKNFKEAYERGEITLDELNQKLTDSSNYWLSGYAQLSDELKDITKDNYEYIQKEFFNKIDKDVDDLKDKFEKTGDTQYLDDQISSLQGGITANNAEIERLRNSGLSDDSTQIQTLLDQNEKWNDDIKSILDQRTNIITNGLEENRKAYDKQYKEKGDISVFDNEIADIDTAKKDLEKQIAEYKKIGYTEDSDEIKDIRKQIADLDDEAIGVYDKIANGIGTALDEGLSAIDNKITETGDKSLLEDKIGLLETAKEDVEKVIDELKSKYGLTEDSETIKGLRKQIQGYSNDIIGVYDEITSSITDSISDQLAIVDREIEQLGDTSKYQIRLNILAEGQKEIQDLIDELIAYGYDENSEVIQKLKKQWLDYGDEIVQTTKNQVDAQVSAYSDVMNEQKEQLEKYKDEQDEIYDAKVKALEDEKKRLQKISDELDKQNSLEEKRNAIENARRNIYKSLRMVYTGNGQWSVKPTQDSLDDLKKAKEDYAEELRKQEIDKIQEQIDTINEAKDKFDDGIDKQIKAINDDTDKFTKTMEKSYKVYGKLDYELIKAIAGEEAADNYLANYEAAMKEIGAEYSDKEIAQPDTSAKDSKENIVPDKVIESLDELSKKFETLPPAMQEFVTLCEKMSKLDVPSMLATVGLGKLNLPDVDSIVNNSTVNHNPSMVLNQTINIEGSADEKTVQRFREIAESKVAEGFMAFAKAHNEQTFKSLHSTK